MPENDTDQILDPAHDPDNHGTNVGAAGLPAPTPKADEKKPDEVTASEDGNILERGGIKYMRAEAVHNERQARQRAESQLAALAPVMPEFEEFLKVRENRRTAVRETAAAGEPDEKAYLEEVATALGLYDETNQPDLRRAQAHLNITRREADRRVDKRVKPVEETSARDRAAVNREKARGAKFVDGQPIADEKYVEAAFNALPEEYAADPQVANLVQVIAAGLQHLDERKSGIAKRGGVQSRRQASSGEPMFVERGSGRVDGDNDGELNALDIAAARARGKSPEEWAKMSKKINSTRGSLEEV